MNEKNQDLLRSFPAVSEFDGWRENIRAAVSAFPAKYRSERGVGDWANYDRRDKNFDQLHIVGRRDGVMALWVKEGDVRESFRVGLTDRGSTSFHVGHYTSDTDDYLIEPRQYMNDEVYGNVYAVRRILWLGQQLITFAEHGWPEQQARNQIAPSVLKYHIDPKSVR